MNRSDFFPHSASFSSVSTARRLSSFVRRSPWSAFAPTENSTASRWVPFFTCASTQAAGARVNRGRHPLGCARRPGPVACGSSTRAPAPSTARVMRATGAGLGWCGHHGRTSESRSMSEIRTPIQSAARATTAIIATVPQTSREHREAYRLGFCRQIIDLTDRLDSLTVRSVRFSQKLNR